MTLESVIEAAERRQTSLVHYAPEPGDLADQFAARNVEIRHRRLPPGGPDPFVVVRRDGAFRGAVTVDDLRQFLWPPIRRPPDLETLSPAYRALFELLDDTVFASLRRRQLLATSREIEDRAWRTRRGTLHAGFQSASAFRAQRSVYRQLVAMGDLDVHVYVATDAPRDELDPDLDLDADGATIHAEAGIDRFWFLVFDGGGDDEQKCALVAEQRGADGGGDEDEDEDAETYYGVWTYDPVLVDRALAADVLRG
jgi:DICT domain-containing protein